MSAPIVIVGATGAIGSATARLLSTHGQALHLVARDGAALTALATELNASSAVADVLDSPALSQAIKAGDVGQGLAGLVYAVGSIPLKPLKASQAADYVAAFQLNAVGAALSVQAAEAGLRLYAQNNNCNAGIVLFSSIAVQQGFTNHSIISMAKGAIEGLTRALAAELAPAIRVNAVAPSLTHSKISASITSNANIAQAIAALHALPRLGEAHDSAEAALYLLRASWVTGQILAVDGGRSRARTKG